MRKSSRGNPYHDERGRFTSADRAKVRSERTQEEYDSRTKERIHNAHYVLTKDGYGLTSSNKIQEGMVVEYAPEWCSEGEEKYVHVVKEFTMNPVTGDPNGRVVIATINTQSSLGSTHVVDTEMVRPAAKEKVEALSVDKREEVIIKQQHGWANREATVEEYKNDNGAGYD